MFTGIVQGKGVVLRSSASGPDLKLVIDIGEIGSYGTRVGDSIAVDGACLTVVERTGDECRFHLSRETLQRTLLGSRTEGDRVNLELALLPTTRVGGHFVTGHVDGIGRLEQLDRVGESSRMRFSLPPELSRFVAGKGSICIDGVSLTVNSVDDDTFEVNVIPHTLQVTTMHDYVVGRQVHLEIDLIARYLDRLTADSLPVKKEPSVGPAIEPEEMEQSGEGSGEGEIDEEFLAKQGFLAPDIGE